MTITQWIKTGLCLMVLSSQTLGQGQRLYLHETFEDYTRTVQNLPASARFYGLGQSHSELTHEGWTIQATRPTSPYTALAYFTDAEPLDLKVGESLVFTFDITVSVATADSGFTGLRFGLFDSGGRRLSEDSPSPDSPTVSNYEGYAAIVSLRDRVDGTGARLGRRDPPNDNLLGALAAWKIMGTTPSRAVQPQRSYTVQLSLTRVSGQAMRLQAMVDGVLKIEGLDTVQPLTTYDTLGIWLSGRNGNVSITNMMVQTSMETAAETISLRTVGQVRPRHAREIASSNWSIGAETMCRGFTIYENWRDYLGPLGFKRARIQSGWARTEPSPGAYDWAWMDAIIPDMVEQGVTPWVSLSYGNPIYTGGGTPNVDSPFPSGEALEAWDRYVRAFVERYKDYVHEWEIWNEPDHSGHRRTAADYAAFALRTAKIIRSEQPEAFIIVGAVTRSGMGHYLRDVLRYFSNQSALDYVNAVSFHPYHSNPDAMNDAYVTLRRMVNGFNPKIVLIQGENGAPSTRQTRFALRNENWSELSQAKWALRRLLNDLGHGMMSSYFGIMDMDYTGQDNTKGVLALPGGIHLDRPDEEKRVDHQKKSYFALQHLSSIFDDRLSQIPDFRLESDAARQMTAYAFQDEAGRSAVTLWLSQNRPDETTFADNAIPVNVRLHGVVLRDPVLVELVTGKVYSLEGIIWQSRDGMTTLEKLPIYDAPVVIIERDLVPMP
jgi:hypothetical protein